MSQGFLDNKETLSPQSLTTPTTTTDKYNTDNNNTNMDNKQTTLDIDAILKSIFQNGHDALSTQDHTVNHSNPSSRRHSVAVGELDIHTAGLNWFDQPTYPVDDVNFPTTTTHTNTNTNMSNIFAFNQPHFNSPHHFHLQHNQFNNTHRRAMSMQQTDSFIPNFDHHHMGTRAEFHPTTTFDFNNTNTNNDNMNINNNNNNDNNNSLFHPTNDIVPTWLLSNTTPPTTNDSIASASPPLSTINNNNNNNNSNHPLDTLSALTTIKTELNNNSNNDDDQKSSSTTTTHKKKKQKKQHPNKNIKNDDPTQQINQLSPTTPNSNNMLTTPLSLPPQLSPDALRSFVQKYICEKYGERSVVILTSRVAQKSYGTEKRFLCPPPTTVLSGSWFTSSSNTNAQPKLTIQISGEATQQIGTIEWSTPPPSVLPTNFISHQQGSTVGRCVSKQLHINDADEKRKRVQVLVNVQLANNENIGTFASKGIKVISKPSKKRQSLKNVDLCIHHGTTISLFNRIRSQTVSTKYLGVSSSPPSSSSSSSSSTSSSTSSPSSASAAAAAAANASNCCFVARTNVWDPFVIWIVDPQRTQQSTIPTIDNHHNHHHHNPQYPPPPAMALHHTGKEPIAIHYNQPIVLQCLTTGLVSPIMTIRKVDKGSMALSGMKVMDATLSTTIEALGDPVSQLHKVAFEIQSSFTPTSTSSFPPYQVSSPTTNGNNNNNNNNSPQHRNTYLACLNDVVGRHKCQTPPQRASSSSSTSSSSNSSSKNNKNNNNNNASPSSPSSSSSPLNKDSQYPTNNNTTTTMNRRRGSTVSPLDNHDPSQGVCFEQDVSDAAVWTIVGTDCIRYTFAVPPPLTPDTMTMRPDIAPFPMVTSISHGDATLCLWGESFTTDLTVFIGDQPLSTEFKSSEALVCVVPSSLSNLSSSSSSTTSSSSSSTSSNGHPILLVRKDGVVYKTDHHYVWKK